MKNIKLKLNRCLIWLICRLGSFLILAAYGCKEVLEELEEHREELMEAGQA